MNLATPHEVTAVPDGHYAAGLPGVRVQLAAVVVLLVAAALLASRWLGPGDLYEKDQPHTLAYTADVVLNGRLALPRDELSQPATKPPLVNWLAAAGVALAGSWSEPVLKWPVAAAALATSALAFAATRRLAGDPLAAALAAGLWLACPTGLRLAWLMRPDMLQAALLTGAWWAATLALFPALHRKTEVAAGPRPAVGTHAGSDRWPWARSYRAIRAIRARRAVLVPVAFWTCVAGAALAKGPAAALPILYAVALAVVAHRSLRPLGRLWPMTGLLLTLAAVGAWLALAYAQNPGHVRRVLLGAELVGRIARASPDNQAPRAWYMIGLWFGSKFLPWSAAALAAVLALAWRGRGAAGHPMLPAALWLGVVLIGLSVPAGKRIDYLLPALVPGGVLAAWTLAGVARRVVAGRSLVVLLFTLVALDVGRANWAETPEARFGYSDAASDFARQVDEIVGGDRLVILVRGKHPLATLLGRHPGDGHTDADLAAAEWVVTDARVSADPVLAEFLPVGYGTVGQGPIAVVGLYRAADLTPAELRAARAGVLDWGKDENPYRDGAPLPGR